MLLNNRFAKRKFLFTPAMVSYVSPSSETVKPGATLTSSLEPFRFFFFFGAEPAARTAASASKASSRLSPLGA